MGRHRYAWWHDPARQFTISGWDGKRFTLTRGNVAYKLDEAPDEYSFVLTPEMVGKSLPIDTGNGLIIYAELVYGDRGMLVYMVNPSHSDYKPSGYFSVESVAVQPKTGWWQ